LNWHSAFSAHVISAIEVLVKMRTTLLKLAKQMKYVSNNQFFLTKKTNITNSFSSKNVL
jgi:hypothetical protein